MKWEQLKITTTIEIEVPESLSECVSRHGEAVTLEMVLAALRQQRRKEYKHQLRKEGPL